ncbi:nucleotidyl transferase AbiEii/AbiGii toxin family protein [Frisingicoccus sp.]|uniref:nucleotidyl transferase AbiEii/AbiGii toxin family protein n=1 Tax=Frisingicoccus sp. TaxID=1918627 RepID=UPI003AB5994F
MSKYAEHFVLKGGIFFYAIFDRNYERVTTDIDLLARRISNSSEEDITEFKEYHGLHVSIVGYLDRTGIPVSIDIGFGDVIYPDAVKMDFPVLLDMEAPKVNAYSMETLIAEKLEAVIHNGYMNSRYKDFYTLSRGA